MPYAPDVQLSGAPTPFANRSGSILYVGTAHPVAITSVEWLVHKVLPVLYSHLQRLPQSEQLSLQPLVLVGSGWAKHLKHGFDQEEHVTLAGSVSQEELERLYSEAKVLLAPQFMTHPSGVATKVVNALSRGLPIVTTSHADVGLPEASSGQMPVRTAKSVPMFVAQIIDLLTNSTAWLQQQRDGFDFLDGHDISRIQLNALRRVLGVPPTDQPNSACQRHAEEGTLQAAAAAAKGRE